MGNTAGKVMDGMRRGEIPSPPVKGIARRTPTRNALLLENELKKINQGKERERVCSTSRGIRKRMAGLRANFAGIAAWLPNSREGRGGRERHVIRGDSRIHQ